MKDQNISRRNILKSAAAGIVAAGTVKAPTTAFGTEAIPSRELGRSVEKVPMLALGGHHIGRIKDDKESISLIREAIDEGITFLDNAWCYHAGRSEELMGSALKDGYRKKVFLMTKVHGRDYSGAMEHLEESLKRFGTDVIDLWQFHDIRQEDPDKIFADGGALEAALKAREEGKIRYIGFTGHNNYEWHRKMLSHNFPFDSVQMPINVFDPHYRSFVENILPILQERKIAIIAMKTLAAGNIVGTKTVSVKEALSFVWSQPVSTLVSGIASREHLHENVKIARNFKPLSESEQLALLARTQPAAHDGEHEDYKARV